MYIVKYWYSYKSKIIIEKSNLTKQDGYEKRFCQHCSDGKRFRIMKTHNTDKCRIKGQEEGKNHSESSNKATLNYSLPLPDLYHESGTSKTMINFMPDIISDNNARIPILTAGANKNF